MLHTRMIRVAGYCRVSTDREDQLNSFESQQHFFRDYILHQPQWELHEIYADEGITGTSTKKRVQFNRMIDDAYSGKFSLILTKEVSRFSRNILDTIRYTRELKALGIGVNFMSDGFSTLDPDAELRLSIMGSIAQEESRKTSTRVKWGQTRQMEKGIVFGTSMLGYDVKNGSMTINPEGAELVRLIFHKYGVEKKGTTLIARELREAGFKTYTGNSLWNNSHILKILKNEKYVGDLVQKKTFTPDYLSHAKKYNHGHEDLVILKNHHEPIVSRELWNTVQDEIQQRSRHNHAATAHSTRYLFSGNIRCAQCGANFVSRVKTRQDGSSYRRWGCFQAMRYGKKKTDNPLGCDVGKLIRDDLALEMLKEVIRNLPIDQESVIRNILSAIPFEQTYAECSENIQKQIAHRTDKKIKALDAYLSGIIQKEEFQQINQRLDGEISVLQDRMMQSKTLREHLSKDTIRAALESILACKTVSEPYLKTLLEYMSVHKDGTVEIKLNQLPGIWVFRLEKG